MTAAEAAVAVIESLDRARIPFMRLRPRYRTWNVTLCLVPLTSGDEIRMGSAVVVYRFTRPDDTTV